MRVVIMTRTTNFSHGARAHDDPGTDPGRTSESGTYDLIVVGETGQTVQRLPNGQGVGEIKELAKRGAPALTRSSRSSELCFALI